MANRILQGLFHLVTGGQSHGDNTHPPSPPNGTRLTRLTSNTAHALQRSPSVEEVSYFGGQRGAESLERERGRKVRLNQEARHLQGNIYDIPASGATAFAPVAATREQNATERETRRAAENTAMGGSCRPRALVNPGSRLHAATKPAGAGPRKNSGSFFGRYASPAAAFGMSPSASGGSQVPKRGFPDEEQDRLQPPSAKKARLADMVSSGPAGPPIDLTDGEIEDYSTATVVTTNPHIRQSSRRGSGPTQLKKQSSQTDIFGNSQLQDTDKLIGAVSTHRRGGQSRTNLRYSGRTSAADALLKKRCGTQDCPEEIEDDLVPVSNGSEAGEWSRQGSQAASRPKIELDQDVDDSVKKDQDRLQRAAQASGKDVSVIHGRPDYQREIAASGEEEAATPRSKRRVIDQPPNSGFSGFSYTAAQRRASPTKPSTPCRRNDGREDEEEVIVLARKPEAARWTQEALRPTSSSEGSLDELQGETTVRSSPRKREPGPTEKTYGTDSRCGDRNGAAQQPDMDAPAQTSKRGDRPPLQLATADDKGDTIPIRLIFCKSLGALNTQGLRLVWDNSQDGYYVLRLKERLEGPHNNKAVCIRRTHVSAYIHSAEHDAVQLKGPSGDDSNGNITLAFETLEGKDDFLQRLSLGDHRPTEKRETSERMNRILTIQEQEQQKWHAELSKQHPTPQSRDTARLSTTRKGTNILLSRGTHRAPSEEHITYESDPEERCTAVSRMQGGDLLPEVLRERKYQEPRRKTRAGDGEISKYFGEQPTRRSTRQMTKPPVVYRQRSPNLIAKWTQINNPTPWPHPVTYPLQGRNRVTVDFSDLRKLDDAEWLNDNLVNFELRYIEETMNADFKDKVHFFNTYLYETLTKNGTSATPHYEGVQRWTKNVDIFTKPFVVVPVHWSMHWFVVIICNLHNIQRKLVDSVERTHEGADSAVPSSEEHAAVKDDDVIGSSQLHPPDQKMENLSLSDAGAEVHSAADDDQRDEESEVYQSDVDRKVAGVEADTAQSGNRGGRKRKRGGASLRKYDPTAPVIIALDSFDIGRSKEVGVLKRYLSLEAETKRGIQLDPGSVQAMSAKGLPVQDNFSDCGVFLLSYIQKFAQNPEEFVRKILQREMTEENFGTFDASERRAEIRDRLLELSAETEKRHKEARKAKREAQTAQRSRASSASRQPASKEQTPSRQETPTPAPDQTRGDANISGIQASWSRQTTPARAAGQSRGKSEHMPQGAARASPRPIPTSQTLAAEEDELPWSPPKTKDAGRERPTAPRLFRPQRDQPNSHSDEMLLNDTCGVAGAPIATSPAQPPSRQKQKSKSPRASPDAAIRDSQDAERAEPDDHALSRSEKSRREEEGIEAECDMVSTEGRADERSTRSPEIPESPEQPKLIAVKPVRGTAYVQLD